MKLTEKIANLKKKVVSDAVSEVFLHLIYKKKKKSDLFIILRPKT